MSSHRAHAARRLASLLAKDTGVPVAVCYQRHARRYRVRWEGGPAENDMQYLACGHADQVHPLSLHELTWDRS